MLVSFGVGGGVVVNKLHFTLKLLSCTCQLSASVDGSACIETFAKHRRGNGILLSPLLFIDHFATSHSTFSTRVVQK